MRRAAEFAGRSATCYANATPKSRQWTAPLGSCGAISTRKACEKTRCSGIVATMAHPPAALRSHHPAITVQNFCGPRTILDNAYKLVIDGVQGTPKELFDLHNDLAETVDLMKANPVSQRNCRSNSEVGKNRC